MLTHELKNPLASIQLSAGMLLNYNERLSAEKREHYLNQILKKVSFISDLLEDILSVGNIDTANLQYKPEAVDVRTLTRDLLDEQAARYPHITFDVSFSGDLQAVWLDERLYRYILANLLSNAAKYSHPDSIAYLSVHAAASELTLMIRDAGIGLSAEDVANLHVPFYRGRRVKSIGGTGLGLAIVKRSIDAHSGSIHFESVEGQGTTVTVKLPTSKQEGIV